MVELMLFDVVFHFRRHQVGERQTISSALTNQCAANVVKVGVHKGHGWWQLFHVDVAAWPCVHQDMKLFDDVIAPVPITELQPVVGTDDQIELIVGIRIGKGVQGGVGIGRNRQMGLEIRHLDVLVVFQGQKRHLHPDIEIGDIRVALFQWVEGRYQQPQLIHHTALAEFPRQSHVAAVDWIERSPEDTDTTHVFILLVGSSLVDNLLLADSSLQDNPLVGFLLSY